MKEREEIMIDPAPTLIGGVDPILKSIADDIKKAAIKEHPLDEVSLIHYLFYFFF